ncbi:phytoene/squalene synthase family protein [Halobacteriaceae archaeon GCM10025711]
MVTREQVARSRAINRRTGRTFYLATRFLPKRTRRATYALYGFFRIADEVVDRADPAPPAEQRAELRRIQDAVLGPDEPDDPALAAFRVVREEYDIPDREVELFVDAMATDVEKRQYETYDELEAYMRGSSVAVANMMMAVMQVDDPETAAPHAAALAEAFQLTNFLRDVREDVVDRDRIYLPVETLREHGASVAQVRDLEMSAEFAAALCHELRRTEDRYREGVAGIKYLPADCQFPVLLAAVLYADYHRLIRRYDADVLTNEPSLSLARKLSIAARTYWQWHRTRDPEAVFHGVSAVSRTRRPGMGPGVDPVAR